jgi:hypothetical protein
MEARVRATGARGITLAQTRPWIDHVSFKTVPAAFCPPKTTTPVVVVPSAITRPDRLDAWTAGETFVQAPPTNVHVSERYPAPV